MPENLYLHTVVWTDDLGICHYSEMALKDLHNLWKSTLSIQSLYYFQVVLTVFSPMNTVKQERFYASKEKVSVVVKSWKEIV